MASHTRGGLLGGLGGIALGGGCRTPGGTIYTYDLYVRTHAYII